MSLIDKSTTTVRVGMTVYKWQSTDPDCGHSFSEIETVGNGPDKWNPDYDILQECPECGEVHTFTDVAQHPGETRRLRAATSD